MALQTMYPAIHNSPQTVTTEQVTASAATIPVADTTKLPAPPNLVTLGVDEDAEQVRYNGVDGNALTGCERGFYGSTARLWPADTLVYRAVTAYDHDTFRANIEGLNAEKADAARGLPAGGLAGQVLAKKTAADHAVEWVNPASGSDASITAYTVTLAAADWAAVEGGFEQTAAIATATALETCIIDAKPRDGLAAWTYDIQPVEQGAGVVTFKALHLPEKDMVYDVTVLDANTVYVSTVTTAIAEHNQDAGAHGNLNIDGNDWGNG